MTALERANEAHEPKGDPCVVCGEFEADHDEDTGHDWTDDGAPLDYEGRIA